MTGLQRRTDGRVAVADSAETPLHAVGDHARISTSDLERAQP